MEAECRRRLQERKIQELEMRTLIREIAINVFYIALIFTISYGNRDANAYLEKHALTEAVVHGSLNCGNG